MRELKLPKILRHLLLLVVTAIMLFTSCGLTRLAKLGEQIAVVKIDQIAFKGLAGLQVAVELRNDSPFDVTMTNASASLLIAGTKVSTLTQVETVTSRAQTTEVISTLWRLSDIDPMALLALSGKVSQGDYSAMTIDFEAELAAGKHKRTITGEGVEIAPFIMSLVE